MNFLLISAIHTQLSLKIYSSKTYNRILFLSTIDSDIYMKELDRFISFLTPSILHEIYVDHFSRQPSGFHYSTVFPYLIKFFRQQLWLQRGFHIVFRVKKVYSPQLDFYVHLLIPRFVFSYIFLVLRHYLRNELHISTLYGKSDINELSEGKYYILLGTVLVSPISKETWNTSTSSKIRNKGFPIFAIDVLFFIFSINSDYVIRSRSKKNFLFYNDSSHKWFLTSK